MITREQQQQYTQTQLYETKQALSDLRGIAARTGFEIQLDARGKKQNGAQVRQIDNHCLNKKY